jgi:hypothetical protein
MANILGRFAGSVISIGPYFGYLSVDGSPALKVWFHRDVCDCVPFFSLRIGDRLRFQVKESVGGGELCAGRIARETKI